MRKPSTKFVFWDKRTLLPIDHRLGEATAAWKYLCAENSSCHLLDEGCTFYVVLTCQEPLRDRPEISHLSHENGTEAPDLRRQTRNEVWVIQVVFALDTTEGGTMMARQERSRGQLAEIIRYFLELKKNPPKIALTSSLFAGAFIGVYF